MTEKLYRLKPWVWVAVESRPGVTIHPESGWEVSRMYCGTFLGREDILDLMTDHFETRELAQDACEKYALSLALPLLEEVPPSALKGPIPS